MQEVLNKQQKSCKLAMTLIITVLSAKESAEWENVRIQNRALEDKKDKREIIRTEGLSEENKIQKNIENANTD